MAARGEGGGPAGKDAGALLLPGRDGLRRGRGRRAAQRAAPDRPREPAECAVLRPRPAEEDRRRGRSLPVAGGADGGGRAAPGGRGESRLADLRSEEHTSELQSLMRNSYAVLCLKKKKHNISK